MSMEYIRGVQGQVDKSEIISRLRKALADEFNAAQQYWMQASLIQGYKKEEIQKELYEHRDEESKHANMIIARMLQLGANPDIRPIQWDKFSVCDYQPILYTDQKLILDAAIQGENCSSAHYVQLIQFVEGKDTTTYDMLNRILEEEYQHIDDLQKLKEMLMSKQEREGLEGNEGKGK